jgi:hypothetical protein
MVLYFPDNCSTLFCFAGSQQLADLPWDKWQKKSSGKSSFKSIYLYAIVGALCWSRHLGRREGVSNKLITKLNETTEIFLYHLAVATIAESQKFWNFFHNDLLRLTPWVDSGCPDADPDDFFLPTMNTLCLTDILPFPLSDTRTLLCPLLVQEQTLSPCVS